MKVLSIFIIILISMQAYAFDLSFGKQQLPYQKIYDDLNKIGFSVFGSFNGEHEGFKGEGKEDESLPVGFKQYLLTPKVLAKRDGPAKSPAQSDLIVQTAGNTISLIDVVSVDVAELKCDREGLAKFLGIKPSEVIYRENKGRIIGPTLIGHQFEPENELKIDASCYVGIHGFGISFSEPFSEVTSFEMPATVCPGGGKCLIPWALVQKAGQSYLLRVDKVIGRRSREEAIKETREYLEKEVVPNYIAVIENIKENNKQPKDAKHAAFIRMLEEYQAIAKDKDFINKVIDRAITNYKGD